METILVVDDEIDIVEMYIIVLEQFGYNVVSATDGIDAFSILKNSKVDLVISNIKMPVVDGFELFDDIKADPNLRHIPFIIVSAINDEEVISKAYEIGVTDYLVKPAKIAELIPKIKKALHPISHLEGNNNSQDYTTAQNPQLESGFTDYRDSEIGVSPRNDVPPEQQREQAAKAESPIDPEELSKTIASGRNRIAKLREKLKGGKSVYNSPSVSYSTNTNSSESYGESENFSTNTQTSGTSQDTTVSHSISISNSQSATYGYNESSTYSQDYTPNQKPQSESNFYQHQDDEVVVRLARNDVPPEPQKEQGTKLESAIDAVKEFAKPSNKKATIQPEEAKKGTYKSKIEGWYFEKQWLIGTKDNHFEELQEYLRINPNATHLVKTEFNNGITESRVIACHKHLVDLIGLEPEKILNGTIWTVIFGAINHLIDDQEIRSLFVQLQQERQNQLNTNPNEDLPSIFLPIDTNTTNAKYPLKKAKYIVTIYQNSLPFDNTIRVVNISGFDAPVSDSDFEKNKEQLRKYLRQNVIKLTTKQRNKPLIRKKDKANLINQTSQDLEDSCKPKNDDPTEAQCLFWLTQAGWHYDKMLLMEMQRERPTILENVLDHIKQNSNTGYILYDTSVFNKDGNPSVAFINQRIIEFFDISKDILGKSLWTLINLGSRFTPKKSWDWVIQQQQQRAKETKGGQVNIEDAFAVFDMTTKPKEKSFRDHYFVKVHADTLFSNDFCVIRAIDFAINEFPCLPPSNLLNQDLLFVLDSYKSKIHWKNLGSSKHHETQLNLDLYLGLFEFERNIETLRNQLYQKCFDELVFHTLPALAKSFSPTRYAPLSELKATASFDNIVSSNFFVKENTIYGNCHIESLVSLDTDKSVNPAMAFYHLRTNVAAALSQALVGNFDQWYNAKFNTQLASNISNSTQIGNNIFQYFLKEFELDKEITQLQGESNHNKIITTILSEIYQCHKTIESAIYFTLFSFDPELFTPDTLSYENDLEHIFQIAYASAIAAKPKLKEIENYQLKKGIKSNSQIKDESYNLAYVLAEAHLTLCHYLYELYIKLTTLNFTDKFNPLFNYTLLMEKPVSFDVAPIVPSDREYTNTATQKVMLRAKRAISRILPEFFDLPENEAQAVVLQIQELMMQRYTEEQQLRAKRQELTASEATSDDPNADDPLGSIRGIYFDDQAREKAASLLEERGIDDKETLGKIRKGKFSVRTYMIDCGKNSCNNCKVQPSHKAKIINFSHQGKDKNITIPRQLHTVFKKDLTDHLKYNKAFIKKQLAI